MNNQLIKQAEAFLPTQFGQFQIAAFATHSDEPMPHIALIHRELDVSKPVVVRIHSECMTGDLFGSRKCDCGEQLAYSLHEISENNGVLIYLRQEGRGIGLINKLKAYQLQEQGFDTIEANTHLGFESDSRQYNDALTILNSLNISQIRLLTNNPLKVKAFDNSTIRVTERLAIRIEPNEDNQHYFDVKKAFMGHLF